MTDKYAITLKTLNEAIEKRFGGGNHPHAQKVMLETKRLQRGVEALGKASRIRNPMLTDAAHERTMANNAKRLEREIDAALHRIHDYEVQGANDINKRLETALNFNETAHGAEIRSKLQSLDETRRHRMINEIIESGDGTLAAAILKAPPLLVGITAEQQQHYHDDYLRRNAPELLAERDVFLETIGTTRDAIKTAKKAANAYYSPERLAEIDSQESAAIEAEEQYRNAWS